MDNVAVEVDEVDRFIGFAERSEQRVARAGAVPIAAAQAGATTFDR